MAWQIGSKQIKKKEDLYLVPLYDALVTVCEAMQERGAFTAITLRRHIEPVLFFERIMGEIRYLINSRFVNVVDAHIDFDGKEEIPLYTVSSILDRVTIPAGYDVQNNTFSKLYPYIDYIWFFMKILSCLRFPYRGSWEYNTIWDVCKHSRRGNFYGVAANEPGSGNSYKYTTEELFARLVENVQKDSEYYTWSQFNGDQQTQMTEGGYDRNLNGFYVMRYYQKYTIITRKKVSNCESIYYYKCGDTLYCPPDRSEEFIKSGNGRVFVEYHRSPVSETDYVLKNGDEATNLQIPVYETWIHDGASQESYSAGYLYRFNMSAVYVPEFSYYIPFEDLLQ